jgi:hypothetical protein
MKQLNVKELCEAQAASQIQIALVCREVACHSGTLAQVIYSDIEPCMISYSAWPAAHYACTSSCM